MAPKKQSRVKTTTPRTQVNPKATQGGAMLPEALLEKARRISECLQEYCEITSGQNFKPKDVLPYLVEEGIFNQIDSRNGRDLREVFRRVDDAGRLAELIPQVTVERKAQNRYWYINTV
ncbi:MAG: hypothetical protein HQ556_07005 [Candidatus Marinimicrobia bacterium]|nr:hypothetical protein [Candidatus Neomarinimicrobiota bacterium]